MVTAEKNTNPFANGNVQNVCGDASLPATAELRGITPLIDPDVDANGGVAALSAQTAGAPLDATGKSVFDLLSEAGFGDLVVAQGGAGGGAAGGAATGGAATGGNANQGNANQGNANQNNGQNNNQNQNAGNGADNAADAGNAGADAGNANDNQNQNQNQNNGNNNAGNAGNNQNQNQNQNNNQNANQNQNQNNGNNNAADQQNQNGNQNGNNNQNNQNNNQNANNGNNNQNANDNAADATGGAADFGQCTPTIFRQGGLGGRPATEFTFQITDELARGGQQEALNPNIITNALCNQLTNVCGANAAAVAQCESAKAAVEAAGTRDDSTVTLFNGAIQGGAARKRRAMRWVA